MEKKSAIQLNRRDFIRQAACAAVGTAAMTAAIRDLRFMNAAVAQTGINDYKALVCIFLAGGNDSNNLIIPTITSEYNNYAAIRTPVLAIPQGSVLPVAPLNPGTTPSGPPAVLPSAANQTANPLTLDDALRLANAQASAFQQADHDHLRRDQRPPRRPAGRADS